MCKHPPPFFVSHTSPHCGTLNSEKSRRLWLFPGSLRGFPRKTLGKSRKIAGKYLSNREMLQILGFRAPGKANLPCRRTLGRCCLDLVPTFCEGCFFEIDSSSLLESFWWMKQVLPLVAFQTQTQNRSVLATQFPKSQPCPRWYLYISALHRKSQLDTLRFGTQFSKSHWPLSLNDPKSQRFKSQRLQDANTTKSQTLAFYESQRFSATNKVP